MIYQSFRALQPQTFVKTHQEKVSALIIAHFWNFCDTQGHKVERKLLTSQVYTALPCEMLQIIFVFKSSQGDVDTITMEHQDPIITAISEQIGDQKVLQAVIDKHAETGQSLMSILREENFLEEEQVARIIAAGNDIEFIDLSADIVNPIAAHMVTSEFANQHTLIPVTRTDNKLQVAMSEPLNLVVRDQIEIRTGCNVIPLAATSNAIRQAVRYHFNVQNATRQAIASMRLKQDADELNNAEPADKPSQVSDDPVTRLVFSTITGAIDTKASDIHIEPAVPDMRVRYRIDGLLRDTIDVPASVQQEVISHIKILADMDISERRLGQDGHIAMAHDGHDYDLRVSSLPAVGGEKIVIRILDKSAKQWSIDTIVTCPDDRQKFKSLVKNPYGMLLLTGPTGSGKTTTLYSILQLLNTPQRNIVTVEDPVEYRLDGITQVQVKPGVGRTFASALRSILRQDPDIILIGEIRDEETAEIAVSAALTGHLVLSTLHTNDAAGAISRLINLGIPPFLVSSALLGTVAQRLIRTTCRSCKKPYSPSSEFLELVKDGFDASDNGQTIQLYRGAGCDDCDQTGYRGRKAIYEILCISHEIRKMIINADNDDNIKRKAIAEGMKTLRKDGIEQVVNGTTTLEELQRLVDMEAE
jgi:type IV pilus assembly protein PilB